MTTKKMGRARRLISIVSIFALVFTLLVPSFCINAEGETVLPTQYKIGAGVYDITGPVAEMLMEGYAKSDQIDEGIHLRLRSRAFIIEDNTGKSVVFASIDNGQLFASVKTGVVNKLAQNGYGSKYNSANIMISASHTHAGISGTSFYALYNISAKGFCEQNYNALVNGIYNSIINADRNLEPGYIEMNRGELDNTSRNRSKTAYANNPADERDKYTSDVDKDMVLLNFRASNGSLIGILNWFAVHSTSMNHHNKLVSGDNKGYASYLFEQSMGTNYQDSKTLVAAFAQSNAGDVSPNINGGENGAFGLDDLKNAEYEGIQQYNKAIDLSNTANTLITGPVDFIHTNVNMSNVIISPEYTSGADHRTYDAALGYSFAAGADDGPTDLLDFKEGMTQKDYPITLNKNNGGYLALQNIAIIAPYFGNVMGTKYPELWPLHYPKPILLTPSKGKPDPFVPDVLELQIFRIGQLALIAQPSEITTMAGRRLRDTIKSTLDQDGTSNTVVIAGLANDYTQYVTTPEEYDIQEYEGASVLYGKWTLDAYRMQFDILARAMVNKTQVGPGPAQRDLSGEQVTFVTGVVLDNIPIGKQFGEIVQNVNATYNKGDTVKAIFWAGHPKNDLKTQSSFLEIQRKNGSTWETVAYDWDWCTTYRWTRIDPVWGTSQATITWTIPQNTPTGVYRVKYNGNDKSGWTGEIRSHTGYSSEFTVN